MLVTILTNLGVVLFGTALGLAIAVNVETVLAGRELGARPPRLLTWHVHAITLYALGFHAKAAVNHLAGIGDDAGALELRLVMFVVLGIVGNAALLIVLRVTVTRRAVARALGRAAGELEAGPS